MVLRSLAQMVEADRWLSWKHVKGHSNNPWNELADTMAEQARVGATIAPCPVDPETTRMLMASCRWLWLEQLPPEQAQQYPPLVDGAFVFEHDPTLDRIIGDIYSSTTNHDKATTDPYVEYKDSAIDADIKVGTANVLTMLDADKAKGPTMAQPARPTWIAQQWSKQGYGIVGVQEARSQCSGTSTFGDYKVFSSAAAKGQGGCQLWLNIQKPYATTAAGEPLKCAF